MLSAIQNVKLPASTSPSPINTISVNNQDQNSLVTTKKQEHQQHQQQQHSHSTIRAADMSRRKQRNPKPIFNPADSENNDQELSIRPVEDLKNP